MIPSANPHMTGSDHLLCVARLLKVGKDGRTPRVIIVITTGRVRVGLGDQKANLHLRIM